MTGRSINTARKQACHQNKETNIYTLGVCGVFVFIERLGGGCMYAYVHEWTSIDLMEILGKLYTLRHAF